MIKCPFCQTSHVANTIFCSECGSYLLEDNQRQTDPLDTGEMRRVIDTSDEADDAPHSASSIAQPIALRLKIGSGKREVEVSLNKVIHIGRMDPSSTVFPEVDLTDEGTAAKSVSRRHARILKQNNVVVLEDLGSVNGTFVNGRRLDAYLPKPLNDGDVLQLGRVSIEVKIQSQ